MRHFKLLVHVYFSVHLIFSFSFVLLEVGGVVLGVSPTVKNQDYRFIRTQIAVVTK